ncbi:hypothetical protein BaRGS_00029114 [Batillaria attramentaria]|uniref:Uncharacterized protein n=1 Tax=Batillaria attramentaria TaxID=370345 RepID=A0ABD0JXL9_9CAEN
MDEWVIFDRRIPIGRNMSSTGTRIHQSSVAYGGQLVRAALALSNEGETAYRHPNHAETVCLSKCLFHVQRPDASKCLPYKSAHIFDKVKASASIALGIFLAKSLLDCLQLQTASSRFSLLEHREAN